MMPATPPIPSPGSHGLDATPSRVEAGPGVADQAPEDRRQAKLSQVLAPDTVYGEGSSMASSCYQFTPNRPDVEPLSPPLSVDNNDHQASELFDEKTALVPVPSLANPPPSPARSTRALPSRTWYFWTFPAEIRNMIYDISLHWPTCQELYTPYNRQIDEHYARRAKGEEVPFPNFDAKLQTPTILLLCRTITRECLPILQNRRFILDRLPPWIPDEPHPMLLSQFMGKQTLQSLRYIELVAPFGMGRLGSGWAWTPILVDVISILREKNLFDHLIIHMSLHNCKSRDHMDKVEMEDREDLQDWLTDLAANNPRFRTPGIIERRVWKVDGLKAVGQEIEKIEHPRIRYPYYIWKDIPGKTQNYPDPTIWPGCVTQFA